MKIKGLLLGMLACAAMVACTNDDIVENNVDNPQIGELENVPAYITVSIGTSNGSSRATVDGDKDGNAEDSGHENGGTATENEINEVAVIIKTVDENGNNVGNSGVAEIIESKDCTTTTVGSENVLTVNSAFKVLAGTHKVLTIVNPTGEIKEAVGKAKVDGYAAIGALYDKFAKGDKLSSYGLKYDELEKCAKAIMFVNRDEVTVEAKSTNSETSPALATIMLERPVAKLAYRGNKTDNTYPITITVTKQKYNIVYRPTDTGKEHPFALVKDAADRIRAVKAALAIDNENWNIVKDAQGAPTECYTYENETIGDELLTPIALQGGEPDGIPDKNYYLKKDADSKWIEPTFIFTPYTEQLGGENGWNVQLTEYALINLTKDSYVIRHTANELGTEVNTFGLLTGKNYIADPFFDGKNTAATTYGFANVDKWNAADWTKWNEAAQVWFNNTLKDVADETNGAQPAATFFNSLSTDVVDDENHDLQKIGTHLQYCFENGVMSHNQLHGLTTGIVFKGVVTGAQDLSTMYQYGTEVYEDLNEIFKAYASGNKDIKAVQEAINKGTYTAESTEGKKAIKDAGIKIYDNNECYYYTNQIKHFDNGDNNVAGNMEFAIVRNNIYSLAVTDIKGIGDAAIDPNPGTENESSVGYIKVVAKIIPWIVRFNNIEF